MYNKHVYIHVHVANLTHASTAMYVQLTLLDPIHIVNYEQRYVTLA